MTVTRGRIKEVGGDTYHHHHSFDVVAPGDAHGIHITTPTHRNLDALNDALRGGLSPEVLAYGEKARIVLLNSTRLPPKILRIFMDSSGGAQGHEVVLA